MLAALIGRPSASKSGQKLSNSFSAATPATVGRECRCCSIRPFTVNGKHALFATVNGLLGFEIGDLNTGKVIQRVEVEGYKPGKVMRHGCPSHGVGLTPDEQEAWVCDSANHRLHVFDATVMPPKQTGSVALRDEPGWVTFSLDGNYAYPSTGDVIDTHTKKVVASRKTSMAKRSSEKLLEIDFQDDAVERTGDQFGIGRVTGN